MRPLLLLALTLAACTGSVQPTPPAPPAAPVASPQVPVPGEDPAVGSAGTPTQGLPATPADGRYPVAFYDFSCAPGFATCPDACADLRDNPRHCGACGRACGRAEACVNAQCVPDAARCEVSGCPLGQRCNTAEGSCRSDCTVLGCADYEVCDAASGACARADCREGRVCSAERVCSYGSCSCPAGQRSCSGQCVPVDDVTNCGWGCESCPGIAGGAAVCAPFGCTVRCAEGTRLCGERCVASPTAQLAQLLPGAHSVAAADFDADGRLDFALLTAAGEAALFLADGRGGYVRAGPLPGEPTRYGLVAGDFDGDGHLDLWVGAGAHQDWEWRGGVQRLRGDGRGGFTADPFIPLFSDVQGVGHLALAELNGDGLADVLVTGGRRGGVVLLPGSRGAETPRTALFGACASSDWDQYYVSSAVAADFDRDGHLDVAGGEGATLTFMRGGTGPFAQPVCHGMLGAPIATRDVDGDGWLDVVSHAGAWVPGGPEATFAQPRAFDLGRLPGRLQRVDLDGDGDVDLLGVNAEAQVLTVLRAIPGGYGPPQLQGTGGTPRWATVADAEGDGTRELLVLLESGTLERLPLRCP